MRPQHDWPVVGQTVKQAKTRLPVGWYEAAVPRAHAYLDM